MTTKLGFSRLLILQNVDFEGPGAILDWARNCGVQTRVVRADRDTAPLVLLSDEAVIALGSPTGNEEAWVSAESIFLANAIRGERHVLGICFGAQLIAQSLGSEIRLASHREIGWHSVSFGGRSLELFQWHRGVFDLPKGATLLARSAATECQAFRFGTRVLAFTGHPEITTELVDTFIERCWTESSESEPFVQSPTEMRREAAFRAAASARFFAEILDSWRRT